MGLTEISTTGSSQDPARLLPLPRSARLWVGIVCGIFALLSISYAVKGFYWLVVKPEMPNDMHLRWVETQYILAGRNPNDIFFASKIGASAAKQLWAPRDTSELPHLGPVTTAGYPPWGYFGGIFFYWSSHQHIARVYFAALNLLSLGLLFGIGYQIGRPHSSLAGLALGFSCTAVSANATTIGLGQYGVVTNALLGITLLTLPSRRYWSAGISLGLALSKPILSGPFGLVLLVARNRRALISLLCYLVVADAAIWAIVKTNPVEMVLQMLRAGQPYMNSNSNLKWSYGLLTLLTAIGVPTVTAELVAAGSGVISALALISRWRKAPVLVHFAIASVAARLWSYHQLYDNVIVTFLLFALGQLALRKQTRFTTTVFAIVGFSLWAPGKFCDHFSFQILQMIIWVFGVVVLLANTSRRLNVAPVPNQTEANGLGL